MTVAITLFTVVAAREHAGTAAAERLLRRLLGAV